MEPYNYIINTAQQPNFETGFAQGQALKKAEEQKQAQAAMQSDLLQLSSSPTVTLAGWSSLSRTSLPSFE